MLCRPYTLAGGLPSHVWFDRSDLGPDGTEQQQSVEAMAAQLGQLIDGEVQSGIPLHRILLGNDHMHYLIHHLPLHRFLLGNDHTHYLIHHLPLHRFLLGNDHTHYLIHHHCTEFCWVMITRITSSITYHCTEFFLVMITHITSSIKVTTA